MLSCNPPCYSEAYLPNVFPSQFTSDDVQTQTPTAATVGGLFIDDMIMVVPVEISRVIIDMEQCRYLFTVLPCASVSQSFCSAVRVPKGFPMCGNDVSVSLLMQTNLFL